MTSGASATDAELARLASVNLNLLVPLMALLEERSVTQAAAKVGLSQPAMSHALRRMRTLLGDELIVRQGATMMLTPRASELIAPLRQALQQTARIVTSSSFDPAVDRRVITVACTTSTSFVIGSALARLIAERAPNTELRLKTTNMTSPTVFTDDGVDVVLLSQKFPTQLARERLYDDRWVVLAHSSAPEGASGLELLTMLPHVAFDSSPHRIRPYEVLDEQGVQYGVRDRITDNLMVPHLVAHAGGVAVHRYRIAAAFSSYLDLRVEEFPFPLPELGVDMVWNPWLADDDFRSWMRDILVETAVSLQIR
ncbi:LysR family transcriptional regulator [Salinibacterium sp. ZJ454]|uniref:LysR family transcriptional regulator n=1 Tax=Salinibacterium sp. ZJ454 TaxID=2708339 RepID=UPI001421C03B|nr:LysR family transcriptional regulator [Salinibacterium sp. ZJ454]